MQRSLFELTPVGQRTLTCFVVTTSRNGSLCILCQVLCSKASTDRFVQGQARGRVCDFVHWHVHALEFNTDVLKLQDQFEHREFITSAENGARC